MRTETLAEFVVLAKYLNYRKASCELAIAQSNLSKHIMSLEREIGFSLFERGNTIVLTPAGAQFLEYTLQILGLLNASIKNCKRMHVQAAPARLWYFGQNSMVDSLMKEVEQRNIPVSFLDGEESLASIFEKDIADLVFFFDLGDTPQMQALRSLGVESIGLGSSPMALVSMASTGPFGSGELSRGQLKGVNFIIPINTYYDEMSCALSVVFGEDLNLRFSLRNDLAHMAMKYFDLREGVFANDAAYIATIFGSRNDVVIHDSIDGKPIMSNKRIYYRKGNANPNVNAVLECIKKMYK